MDSKEMVRQLIYGSEAIDQMRKEIDSVVRMVLGFIAEIGPLSQPIGEQFHQFRSGGCSWYIHKDNYNHPMVASFVIPTMEYDISYHSCSGANKIPLRHVQRVWEALPIFIEGMTKNFPRLEEHMQPLLRAADAAMK